MANTGFFGKLKLNARGALSKVKGTTAFKTFSAEAPELVKAAIVSRFRKSRLGVDLESRAVEQAVKERIPTAVYVAGGTVILILIFLLFKKRR